MRHTVLRTGRTWEPGMLPGGRNDPRDSSARSLGEEWAVATSDGGEGRKSGHISQSFPAGGLKSWNVVFHNRIADTHCHGLCSSKREHSVLRKQDGAVAWW